MALNDVQNLIGKTLDAQSIFQQSVAQSELAVRQTERRLALERQRQEAQIEAGTSSAEGQATSLEGATVPNAEKQRRYHLVFRLGQGAVLEMDEVPAASLHRLDLTI